MLINKLLFLFQANADSVKKETKEAEAAADDLTDAMKEAEKQAKKTKDKLIKLAKRYLGWLAAATAASKTMGMAVARAGEIEALDTLSLKMGTSITQTDALARSIADMGTSSKEAQDDLGRLADGLLKDGIEPMEGLLQLSDELAGMDYGQASARLKEYRITNSSTVELLRKGRAEIERSMKQQMRSGAITQEAAEKAKAFNQSLNNLKRVSSDAANSFVQFLMPALTKVIDFLAKAGKWAVENKTFLIAFFAGVAGIVTALYGPAMLTAAAATIAATWPFIAIGAAIGAAAAMFALIDDDIMHFIDGNDSLIGQIIDDFPIVGEIINFIVEGIKIAFAAAGAAADALWNGFKSMASGIVGVLKWLWDAVKSYIGFITDGIGRVADVVGSVGGWIGDKLGFSADVQGSVSEAKNQTGALAANSANAMTSSAINNQRTNNIESNLTIGQVTVETQATDAAGVSAGLSDSLSAELEKMQANNATPITR